MVNSRNRRVVDFDCGEQVIAEVQRLQSSGYDQVGKWNLSQICEHLGKTIELGLRPTSKRMPWVIRKLVGEPMVRGWLKRRSMKAGGMTAPALVPKPQRTGDDDPALIDRYLDVVREAEGFGGPLPPYVLGDITLDDWKQLQWIHASHHLGFLLPKV